MLKEIHPDHYQLIQLIREEKHKSFTCFYVAGSKNGVIETNIFSQTEEAFIF